MEIRVRSPIQPLSNKIEWLGPLEVDILRWYHSSDSLLSTACEPTENGSRLGASAWESVPIFRCALVKPGW